MFLWDFKSQPAVHIYSSRITTHFSWLKTETIVSSCNKLDWRYFPCSRSSKTKSNGAVHAHTRSNLRWRKGRDNVVTEIKKAKTAAGLPALLAPHTSGPRDVPRCGALSLLQKDTALQGGSSRNCCRLNVKLCDLPDW
jgi:hypothetical protein